ncbi:MAG: M23 family metallopeptidase [Treponema sp.]|jgi:murein DD-endopeptidase MepM/ murein hydrolase activator NlpD|nr:M23 family metallopeptidase [Treponema sp.]
MVKFGKGWRGSPAFALAFLLFRIIFVSFLCHAQDGGNGGYLQISQLNPRDENFKKLIADVQTNRRRVFNREKSRNDPNRESADDIAQALTIYRYVPKEDDSIISLAARCSIPYSSLASVNRIGSASLFESGRPLLIPTTPGIFVPREPNSDIEFLLASRRFSPDDTAEIEINGVHFYFFPGKEYDSTERAFFLNTGFRFPLRSYRLTSPFGMRTNPVTGNLRIHQGIDLAAPAGTEVYAAGDGVVTETGNDSIYGNYVIIKHNNNWASLYGHLQRVGTTLRSNVKSGTIIGWVGSTGQSTGPHLHFELRQNGRAQDPNKLLFSPGGR